ncbi:hypothetical protein SETIT_3G292400v2 [Setaria italica]|uniref:Pentacotripeptide-repeat region of PRORP domain-containing protein n=2 Tax=Setaria italica TaxID=4555 RepID=K3Z9X4_SETIT|nr:hypothetical protein SETIT_3G292400v2 [Setaria italica]
MHHIHQRLAARACPSPGLHCVYAPIAAAPLSSFKIEKQLPFSPLFFAFHPVHNLFNKMPLRGFAQDVVSYAALVEGLCETGRIDEALELFREMKRPNMHTYVALVRGLCDARRGKEGLCMLQKMKKLGWSPSTRAYVALVDLWFRERMVDEAEKMMEGDGLAADQYTCNVLEDALVADVEAPEVEFVEFS